MSSFAFGMSPKPFESAISLALRITMRLCIPSIADCLLDLGINWPLFRRGQPAAIQHFADIIDTDSTVLLRDSCAPRSEGQFSFRGHLLDRPMVNRREIRLCPHCILEDDDREGALGRYGRSYWQLTQFRTCPRHGTPIMSLPAPRHALDFAPVVERSLESIRQNAGAATVRQHGFESWLLHRLAGQRTDYWFDDLEISVVAQFCEKVGIALCFGGATAPRQLEDGQLAIATGAAFQHLAATTTGVEPLLREIWTNTCSTRPA
ncbi:TniQ family protein [Paenirhodobacter populi]|uniref:TniQ domain-containing protein n=1 Tax=Paenirhodobacter populi TaxID=2306993 RepID=A0A443JI43_9RHOB|nr:TniQ family protein [Sinirhodobacter populi]RWR20103.1 hypothetical protein D2T30_11720 [Sinirhodobacter populi]